MKTIMILNWKCGRAKFLRKEEISLRKIKLGEFSIMITTTVSYDETL